MKHINNNRTCVIASLVVFPTIFFLAGSALNIEPGLPVFYDMAEPLLVNIGLNEKLGSNASILICFGPIVALGLTLYSLTKDSRGQQKKNRAPVFFM